MANVGKVWNGTAWVDLGSTATFQSAGTATVGVVQLTDSTSSTSTTTAATPNSVKSAYDLAGTAIPKNTATTAGDILYASGSATVTRLGIGTANQVLQVISGLPSWQTLASAGADVQEFTSSGSWVKPAGKTAVFVFAVGGGGGGAGGNSSETTTRVGGGGGWGGNHTMLWLPAASLPGTVTVTVGAGGAGGASSTTTSANPGSDGGETTFGSAVIAYGGRRGLTSNAQWYAPKPGRILEWVSTANAASRTSSAPGTSIATLDYSGTANTIGVLYFGGGLPGGARTTGADGFAATDSYWGTGGGGGGSGDAISNILGGAGAKGFGQNWANASGGSASTAPQAGTALGYGGGGGGAGGTPTAGAVGFMGGGGGGGGRAYPLGVASGAGGAGGTGYVLVISV